MNSFNHYSYGSVGKWMFSVIGGIDADEACPGYRRVRIAPRMGGGLTYARTKYRSLYGDVCVAWENQGDSLVVTIEVPCNAEAVIDLSPYGIADGGGLDFSRAWPVPGRVHYRIVCRI